jgi:hypothetical protein
VRAQNSDAFFFDTVIGRVFDPQNKKAARRQLFV